MIIDPFLNNPKTLNYQWSNSIYKPKTKKRTMNFMEEINEETQKMLKEISIRKAEKTSVAKKRIAELKQLIKFWEEQID